MERTALKSSRFYQNGLQVVGRLSTVTLFLCGFYLGREAWIPALVLLFAKLGSGFLTSELMYKRLQSVVKEGQETRDGGVL